MIRATILGTGGYVPSVTRGLAAAYLKVDGTNILIDCGEGTQVACMSAGVKLYDISIICITHRHADHVLGLAGILTSIDQIIKVNHGPKKLITIIAPRSCKEICDNLIRAANATNVNVEMLYVKDDQQTFTFSTFKIDAVRLDHTVECYGYSVQEIMQPHFNQENADRSGLPEECWKFLQTGHGISANGEDYSLDAITAGKANKGTKIAYATDTRVCPGLITVMKDADLAIVEGMYFNKDQQPKTFQPKHLTYEEAAKAVKAAGAKHAVLTHFNPTMSDPNNGLHYATDIFSEIECGEPGVSLEVFDS